VFHEAGIDEQQHHHQLLLSRRSLESLDTLNPEMRSSRNTGIPSI
jgi:hypothetical protein